MNEAKELAVLDRMKELATDNEAIRSILDPYIHTEFVCETCANFNVETGWCRHISHSHKPERPCTSGWALSYPLDRFDQAGSDLLGAVALYGEAFGWYVEWAWTVLRPTLEWPPGKPIGDEDEDRWAAFCASRWGCDRSTVHRAWKLAKCGPVPADMPATTYYEIVSSTDDPGLIEERVALVQEHGLSAYRARELKDLEANGLISKWAVPEFHRRGATIFFCYDGQEVAVARLLGDSSLLGRAGARLLSRRAYLKDSVVEGEGKKK